MPNTNAKAESRAPQVPSLASLNSQGEKRKKRKWFLCPDIRAETHSTMLSVVIHMWGCEGKGGVFIDRLIRGSQAQG